MISKIENSTYTIAGTSRKVAEAPVFKPENGKLGYGIFDGKIIDKPTESSARWVIEPGYSSRSMELVDNNYRAIRSVTKGNGYVLMVLSEKQIVCHPVKEGDQISFGIGDSSVDTMIAAPNGPGLEIIELSPSIFNPSLEKEVKPDDKNIPKEFFTIKKLLEKGDELKAFKILKKYQSRHNPHFTE